jgi:hypothetical protein
MLILLRNGMYDNVDKVCICTLSWGYHPDITTKIYLNSAAYIEGNIPFGAALSPP